jgi:Tfp pilus assembly major pilin PilA
VNGWNSIGTALSLVGVAIGFLLPWLGVLIVLAGIAAAIAIPLVRRTRAQAAAGAKPASASKTVAGKPAPRARKPQPKK